MEREAASFREPHGLLPPPSPLTTPFSFSIHHCCKPGRLFLILRSVLRRRRGRVRHGRRQGEQFDDGDFLPSMARKLGAEGQGLIQELCKGFQLLMDPRASRITFQSLKRNAARLGLQEMMREGDMDGDGVLDQTEFCILMVRLSPELMEQESNRLFEC